jgi:hypothetical protein
MKVGLLIEQYLSSPEMLRRAISRMSEEQLNARPIPRWSTREVVFSNRKPRGFVADPEMVSRRGPPAMASERFSTLGHRSVDGACVG